MMFAGVALGSSAAAGAAAYLATRRSTPRWPKGLYDDVGAVKLRFRKRGSDVKAGDSPYTCEAQVFYPLVPFKGLGEDRPD